jgi:hypothetical protein
MGLGTSLMWAISSVALVVYTRDAREPELHTLVIPDGTAESIAEGENPLQIPANWSFLADDTLRLVNDDSADHWFGSFFAPAMTTRDYTLQPSLGGSVVCSLHPDGAVTIDVDVRNYDLRATLIPTLVLGPAIGLVVLGVTSTLRHLDEPEPSGRHGEARRATGAETTDHDHLPC